MKATQALKLSAIGHGGAGINGLIGIAGTKSAYGIILFKCETEWIHAHMAGGAYRIGPVPFELLPG